MQRRKLDRDAGAFIDAAPRRGPADGVDGALVFARSSAPRPRRSSPPRPACRRSSGSPAPPARGCSPAPRRWSAPVTNCSPIIRIAMSTPRADERLAAAGDEAGQRRRQARLAGRRRQPAGDHEAPGRGVDEQRRAAADMRAPVAGRDLVADQRVAGRGVGNAQQRLGEAHERHALLARQRIFLDQALDARCPVLGAQRGDQLAGGGPRGLRCSVAASPPASSGARHSGSGRR